MHDTISRVMAIVSPEFLQKFKTLWNEMLNSDEGEKIKKILAVDGKTQHKNANINQDANHIVGMVDENGLSLAQRLVNEKLNEITAIPKFFGDPDLITGCAYPEKHLDNILKM